MSNYDFEADFNIKDIRLREKQCRCSHPSFKCPLCGLFKDNLFNEYRTQIEVLETLLDIDEQLLTENGVGYISIHELDIGRIIKDMIEVKRKKFNQIRQGLLLEE